MSEGCRFEQRHGKSKVRVSRVWRRPAADGGDVFVEWNVNVSLLSDCLEAYTAGDNSAIVATDTMKNTVRSFSFFCFPFCFTVRSQFLIGLDIKFVEI